MQAEAMRHIANDHMDDTFYIIDLGNVARMFKVRPRPKAAPPRVVFIVGSGSHPRCCLQGCLPHCGGQPRRGLPRPRSTSTLPPHCR